MKKLFLFGALALWMFQTNAQDDCKDIIYPEDNTSIIFNCCIYEVLDNNVVYYTREGDSASIAAASIVKDGKEIKFDISQYEYQAVTQKQITENQVVPDGLYRGKDYNYYAEAFRVSTNQRNAGVIFTVIGLGLEIGGFAVAANSNTFRDDNLAALLIVTGGILEMVGIPLWVAGGVKRANNKRVMNDMERNMNLSFGASGYGAGLVLKF